MTSQPVVKHLTLDDAIAAALAALQALDDCIERMAARQLPQSDSQSLCKLGRSPLI